MMSQLSLAEKKLLFRSFAVHRMQCKRLCRTVCHKESRDSYTPLAFLKLFDFVGQSSLGVT